MWLSQSSVNVYQTYQSLYQFQHFAAKCDSAMDNIYQFISDKQVHMYT